MRLPSGDSSSPLVESVLSVLPVMGIPATRTDIVKYQVGSIISWTPFHKKPLPDACAVVEKEKWGMVGRW